MAPPNTHTLSAKSAPTLEAVEQCWKKTEAWRIKCSIAEDDEATKVLAVIHRAYEEKAKLQEDLDKKLDRLTKISFHQLSHQITVRLPREIRDMIYTTVLERDHVLRNNQAIEIERIPHERHLGPLSPNDPSFPPIHLWDTAYCDVTFVRELAEMCYRQRTFEFRQEGLYLLPTFLGKGALLQGKGSQQDAMKPIEHVGSLRIRVKPTRNGWNYTLQNLRVLSELRRKAKLEFVLDKVVTVFNGVEDIEQAIREFGDLFPLFAEMREHGHTLTVHFRSVRVHEYADNPPIPPRKGWQSSYSLRTGVSITQVFRFQSVLFHAETGSHGHISEHGDTSVRAMNHQADSEWDRGSAYIYDRHYFREPGG
ncbi:hypothetical protein BU23DRAFT_571681 [Bimuria novae-zelandiae CBS 107.79]|uniref:Uncharacterized protein n=1 Tax=Bimuria novae-zelandiae CBS 107.79 TaxID=1447943 RepID=A0A6A5UXA3_9PLEO|nr:hypothetical protein BU23DRAFT_571681 [Bimuria novae-zelandiae CBS 107.79]